VPDKADDVNSSSGSRGGDADALGELYDRYGRVAFGVLYRCSPGPEAAEEVAQDAFHSVWRQARSYRAERGSVRTWLLAICRNAAIDWRRTRGKRLEREVTIEAAAELLSDAKVDERVVARLRAEHVRASSAVSPQSSARSSRWRSGVATRRARSRRVRTRPRHGEEPCASRDEQASRESRGRSDESRASPDRRSSGLRAWGARKEEREAIALHSKRAPHARETSRSSRRPSSRPRLLAR